MSELSSAIKQICEEKGLDHDAVITTIESALAAAFRKDFGEKNQNIKVEFDPETGQSKVFDVKTVVEDLPEEELVEEGAETDNAKNEEKPAMKEAEDTEEGEEKRKFNPKTDLQISEAKLLKKTAKIGDEIKTKLEVPNEYGRMAAQTAKQVIVQRLREAEREMVFGEFKGKEKEVVSGVIQRKEGRFVLIDLGKTMGILPQEEQIFGEVYKPNERIKVYIKEVRLGSKGPEIILSRTSDEILKKVFYLEIPEISNGLVELKAVAREAGSRSKVAVYTDSENVDPIGSCVGQRGARIQTIISELGGEKIDIIQYDENPVKFIANALSPAKIVSIEVNNEEKKSVVKVLPDQLSLAIGRSGQNARLAARLTGWKIDIIAATEKDKEKSEPDETLRQAQGGEEKKEKAESGEKETLRQAQGGEEKKEKAESGEKETLRQAQGGEEKAKPEKKEKKAKKEKGEKKETKKDKKDK